MNRNLFNAVVSDLTGLNNPCLYPGRLAKTLLRSESIPGINDDDPLLILKTTI